MSCIPVNEGDKKCQACRWFDMGMGCVPAYGENDTGIFFFTPDGRYIEWMGEYLYSDIPFTVNNPVVTYQEAN